MMGSRLGTGGRVGASAPHLEPMVSGVRYVEVLIGIQCDTPRLIKLAGRATAPTDDLHGLKVRVKDLDAVAAEFTDILVAGAVDANIVGVAELA